MGTSSNEVIIMFADIVGSTRLYEVMGDEVAEKLVTTTLKQLSYIAGKSQGATIKTGGDDDMCRFNTVDHALKAQSRKGNAPVPHREGLDFRQRKDRNSDRCSAKAI